MSDHKNRRERERECVCVCVCVRERERERERGCKIPYRPVAKRISASVEET
uniref:Uncharacterized protein n=1 Tax=Musa acuminata subsp. malaccensis TaxID=214687 RepID=A0A804KJV4_MUSAM